ncbi:sulfotransferase family protein [Allonocardiopsis opalescens]|uniref:Sulfotransferase family protein n=1 Tax=Allonocardiopsis opalescens TaxID=1144618 RepID=A0A2T0QF89_9ACTN|nr:sulfotransferase family protein [Allonocardiopsis opalescens]PRY02513.1 hypothetical protein CLV72_1011115 [Allonocardiopsis opalescens]
MTVIALWAHPRSLSTAFLRMMIERGDVTVVHEPLVTLVDTGEVALPDGAGGTVVARSAAEVFDRLRELASDRPVFFKDTVEYRYGYLFEHPERIADITHTFIVRDPRPAIASLHAMKPTAARHEFGYEHLYDIFALVRAVTGRAPAVVDADRLLADPAAVVAAYCAAVGLPFVAEALSWRPGDRAEWSRTRQWHRAASASSGFQAPASRYTATVDDDALLRSHYDYHRPFYDELVKHAI